MSIICARVIRRPALASIMLLVLTAGCDARDLFPLVTATNTLSEEFKTGPAPEIIIETFNGSIDVSNGQSDEVVVEVTKRAGGFNLEAAETNLNAIEVSMIQKENKIYITARRLERQIGNMGATVVVAAPREARLRLKSSNGHVICEGMQSGIVADTSNARVDVVEGRGALDLTTNNGAIGIEADDAIVDAHTSNARVEFHGTLADGEQTFKSSNGSIELFLPAASRFRLDCSTSNSRVRCDFPLKTTGRASKRSLQGVVGEDPRISIFAKTSNASIRIRKADGADD